MYGRRIGVSLVLPAAKEMLAMMNPTVITCQIKQNMLQNYRRDSARFNVKITMGE